MRYFLLVTTILMSAGFGLWAQNGVYTAPGPSVETLRDPGPPPALPIDDSDTQKLIHGNFSNEDLKWSLSIDNADRVQSNMAVTYQVGKELRQYPLLFPKPIRWNQFTRQFEADAVYPVDGCQYPAQVTFSAYKSGMQSELDVEIRHARVLYIQNCGSSMDQIGLRFTFVRTKSTKENLVGVIHYTGGFLAGNLVETKDLRPTLLVRLALPKFCHDVEISEVSTLQGAEIRPALLVDALSATYEVNGKDGAILSGVRVSLNGPPHQECDIPVYASFVEIGIE